MVNQTFSVRFSIMIFLLVSMVIGCGEPTPSNQQTQETQEQKVESIAPKPNTIVVSDDLQSEAISEGNDVKTAVPILTVDQLLAKIEQRNGKGLFLNFWASWCDPCKEEMPHITELFDEYETERVEFLGVSLDSFTGTEQEVPKSMKTLGINFPVVILKMQDQNKDIPRIDPEWKGQIPHTIVYNNKGEIVQTFSGPKKKITFESAIHKITSTLK
jgi:thiol-disulfide isomerase/thioredoxin